MKRIDTHMHIGHWPTLRKCENMILRMMESHQIDFAFVSNADCSEFPSVEREGWELYKATQEEGLEECIRFARRNEGKIGVLVWVNPNKETISKELIDLITNNRDLIYGLKIHPWESRIKLTHDKLIPYMELAKEFRLPVYVHTAKDKYSDIRYLGYMAKDYPDIKFVAAHMQLNGKVEDCIRLMRNYPNVYADTAWVKMSTAEKVIAAVGSDRIFFGTDSPIDGETTLDEEIYEEYFTNALALPEEDYENIMWKNAKRVFHIHMK